MTDLLTHHKTPLMDTEVYAGILYLWLLRFALVTYMCLIIILQSIPAVYVVYWNSGCSVLTQNILHKVCDYNTMQSDTHWDAVIIILQGHL